MTDMIHSLHGRHYGARTPKRAPLIPFGAILTGTAPATPFAADYLSSLDGTWQMLGNDRAGDCEAVRWANNRYLITSSLTTTPHYPSQDDVWTIYQTQNPGFVPGTGPHGYGSADDAGMDSQTLCEYLTKTAGPDGVQMVAFAAVDPTNLPHVQLAMDVFGAVWVDIIVLDGNQTEFSEGKPWTVSGAIDGGHAVLGGGTPATTAGVVVDIETWAAETGLTEQFWTGNVQGTALVQQVLVPIWPEHLGTRQFDEAIDVTALADEYAALTGKTLVLPTPTPAPTPSPAPAPTPVPSSGVTVTLSTNDAATLNGWSEARHVGSNAAAAAAWRRGVQS